MGVSIASLSEEVHVQPPLWHIWIQVSRLVTEVQWRNFGGAVSEGADGTQLVSQDERTMAILAHVLQVVGWWIAPLIIFLIKRESRFTSFHALQALLLQIVYMVVMAGFMVLWFGSFFLTMAHHSADKGAPPPAIFILMPLIWLGFMGMWVIMLVIAVVYGVKAGRGEWAAYPLLGRLARKILKMQPDGTALFQSK